MRPFRSFLLLLFFLICFAGLYYIAPWKIDLPSLKTFIPGYQTRQAEKPPAIAEIRRDPVTPGDSTRHFPDSLPRNSTSSYNPIQAFLDSVNNSKGQVRIMYYGDSQIEGDRVTSFLRSSLRKGHNGTGPGLFLPVMPVPYTRSVYVRASSNWKRYSYLSFKNGEIAENNLGPLLAMCRYLPAEEFSVAPVKAWIRIVPSRFADKAAADYSSLRILYRNTLGDVNIEVRAGENPVIAKTLETGPRMNEFVCQLYGAKNVLIDFSGNTSPDIYGISIESETGIIVDNIPQRGSAGLEFTMIDKEGLKEAFGLLRPNLVVLHYGLNLVRNVRSDYDYYEKGLVRQLNLLKEISPGTGFIMVGLTDMAYSDGDIVRSYPNIPSIIRAQKNAAKESGAVFWDAEAAMGGDSSIIRWFALEPPLAKKDYVHLTDQGADTLARMLMSDIFSLRAADLYAADTLPAETAGVSSVPDDKPVQRQDPGKDFRPGSLLSAALNYDPDKPFIFTSPAFWIFFLIVLAGYSLFYRKLAVRNLYLFLVSLFFYYKTGGFFLFILIFVTLIDYTCGLLIYNAEKKWTRKLMVLISVISNLGLLGYFKYTGFIVSSVNSLLGTHLKATDLLSSLSNSILNTSFDLSYIILPVGISFFTFQSLSYTIDVYRRKMEPVRNIIDFGFYVSFFPHLVAGPIVRASVFIPQIYQEFRVTKREFSHALFMISKGLIKKIIISNFIAVNLVDRVFDAPVSFSGFENLLAVYGYGLQIYCDFSGYTDIAIGIALILGFRLPLNFNSPYKAVNISDFWRRWHISLSQWLKDYLYISLGGNRKGRVRTIINLMITMLLGGLWHGANLRFIIWGGLHGLGLAVNKIGTYIFGERTEKGYLRRAISIFLTFQFVSFCWIFFRAPDMHSAGLMLRQIFASFSPESFAALPGVYRSVLSLMAAGYFIHFLPEKFKESYRGFFIRIPIAAQLAVIFAIALVLYQMRTTEILPFIYFRF